MINVMGQTEQGKMDPEQGTGEVSDSKQGVKVGLIEQMTSAHKAEGGHGVITHAGEGTFQAGEQTVTRLRARDPFGWSRVNKHEAVVREAMWTSRGSPAGHSKDAGFSQ